MARYIRYAAPSLTPDDLSKVAESLRQTGCSLDSPGGVFLHLAVRALTLDSGTFLEIDEDGDALWDLSFARALSAAADGFVSTVKYLSGPGHYGEALFFAGRTLQARSWSNSENDLDYGPVRSADELVGVHVQELYNRRFEILCDPDRGLLTHGRLLASEELEMATHPLEFYAGDETGFALVVVGNVGEGLGEQIVQLTEVAGWRRRIRYSHGLAMPYAELRREGPLEPEVVKELSKRLNGTAVGLEVAGAARPFSWASAYRGALEGISHAGSATDFVRTLDILASQMGETPGTMFGYGPDGWLE
jgi:hypothetical protein